MSYQESAYRYLGAFVDELVRAGVKHVSLAPGSRSTPLALMLAGHPRIKLWLHLDERSAAFFGLGMAKASGEPVALLCTSGTAAANFFPAVVEAHYGRVPLLVLTADRPPELRDAGAAQTIDQLRLYGAHAKWSVEVPVPEATTDLLRYARTLAGRAVATALESPAGPVHLNFPLREPLIPLPPSEVADGVHVLADAWAGRPDGQPFVEVRPSPRVPDSATVDALATRLAAAPRGLIVCGPQSDPSLAEPLARLARTLGYPLLADPLSGLRCGEHDLSAVIDSYDAFLRDGRVEESLAPELTLRIGAIPTSKPALLFLQRQTQVPQILLGEGWEDPSLLASDAVLADPRAVCEALLARLDGYASSEPQWLARWRRVDERTREAIDGQLQAFEEPFEGRVFAELAQLLPDDSTLFSSSSMPVRDLDTFFAASPRRIRFLANRGANGIDGVVSSALGAGAVADGPLILTIGDIALYHDMNGLLAAKLHGLDATVVLLNNDGGGIFSFLPQAEHGVNFEALFGTPHGLDFRPVAELYGARYTRADDWDGFRSAIEDSLYAPGLNLVEVRTDRERNVALHREVWRAVSAALDEELAWSSTR